MPNGLIFPVGKDTMTAGQILELLEPGDASGTEAPCDALTDRKSSADTCPGPTEQGATRTKTLQSMVRPRGRSGNSPTCLLYTPNG